MQRSSSRGSSSETSPDSDAALPTYNPLSHAARREKLRLRSAQNAVHFIPLLLLLCAFLLWFFSYPGPESKS